MKSTSEISLISFFASTYLYLLISIIAYVKISFCDFGSASLALHKNSKPLSVSPLFRQNPPNIVSLFSLLGSFSINFVQNCSVINKS